MNLFFSSFAANKLILSINRISRIKLGRIVKPEQQTLSSRVKCYLKLNVHVKALKMNILQDVKFIYYSSLNKKCKRNLKMILENRKKGKKVKWTTIITSSS